MPAMLPIIAVVSITLPFFTAAITPRNIPPIHANNIAVNVRTSVAGSASKSTSAVFFFDW